MDATGRVFLGSHYGGQGTPRMQNSQSGQTIKEEIANSVLHGIGVLLGITGLILLVLNAHSYVPVYVIFASAMILMFFSSTMYHALLPRGAKELFRMFDHQAIYIFIAGTYTPYCFLAFKGTLGWVFFAFEWGLALTGIILSAIKWRFLKKAELTIFILMGWVILAGTIPLARALPLESFILLFAGGAAYTAGTFWYRAGKEKFPAKGGPKQRRYGAHVIWHILVMAGAVCHWFSVWFLCLTV
ncbi:hemolysin III [Spirochaetia bacterium]|nr:hemolysin III [Spirochaetia bacterium]